MIAPANSNVPSVRSNVPVLVMLPYKLNTPVLETVTDAPGAIIIVFANAVLAVTAGYCERPLGITTSLVANGTPPHQLEARNQSVLPPSQVTDVPMATV